MNQIRRKRRQTVGQQLQNEWMTTYKVLAAIPEAKRTTSPSRIRAAPGSWPRTWPAPTSGSSTA